MDSFSPIEGIEGISSRLSPQVWQPSTHFSYSRRSPLRRRSGDLPPIHSKLRITPSLSVFRIIRVRPPEMELSGISQGVDGKVHLAGNPSDPGPDLPPVVLELFPGLRLEPHRPPGRSQHPFGRDIPPEGDHGSRVPLLLTLPKNHHCVPDPLSQQPVDFGLERLQFADMVPFPSTGCATPCQGPPYRSGMHSQGIGDVGHVHPFFFHLDYHVEVLPLEHRPPPGW